MIFQFFKMVATALLGFQNRKILLADSAGGCSRITVPDLVMIDAVLLIILMFQYLPRLAGKRLFTPPKLVFWGYLTP